MSPHPPHHRRPWSRLAWVACCAMLGVFTAGCGSESAQEEFDEFDLIPARPLMSEVEFGHFTIPVPGQTRDAANQVFSRNYLQLEFKLFAVVAPEDESETARLAERRRGELRDRVIQVCRNTSPSELKDPELLTLKLRLIDATQPVFEGVMLDTLLLRDLLIDAL